MSNNRLFITGTDTNIGKTIVAASILYKYSQNHQNAIGIKPISTGGILVKNELQQEDTMTLIKYSTIKLNHKLINPWCYQPAVSPHIAANLINQKINIHKVKEHILKISNTYPNYDIIAEGAGGIYCPINDNESMLDLIQILNWPVVVVIGLKLGCLNHTLLTIDKLNHLNIDIHGWITNQIAPMDYAKENIDTLKKLIKHKYLGHIPFLEQPDIKKCAELIEI